MAQLVEHNLAKVGVAGSSPVVRSIWAFSSGGERFPDTEEVRSSNLLTPTKCSQLRGYVLWAVLFYVAKSAGSSNRPSNHPAHTQNRVNSHRGRGQRVSNPSEPQLLSKTPRCLRPAVSLSHLHLQHQGATMRTELDVPFSHKEEAKALGAKWDRTKKI